MQNALSSVEPADGEIIIYSDDEYLFEEDSEIWNESYKKTLKQFPEA